MHRIYKYLLSGVFEFNVFHDIRTIIAAIIPKAGKAKVSKIIRQKYVKLKSSVIPVVK